MVSYICLHKINGNEYPSIKYYINAKRPLCITLNYFKPLQYLFSDYIEFKMIAAVCLKHNCLFFAHACRTYLIYAVLLN